jgi:ribosome-associated translation inhibitor RaiA
MEIGDALTGRAKEACISLAGKYGIEFIDVSIVIKKDGYLFCCDISIKAHGGDSYYASNDASDPHVSFDQTLHKIDQQMQKKKRSERNSCKKHLQPEINNFDSSLEKTAAPVIIAEIIEDLPLLSVSDAVKRLNDETKVFIFENISNNAINVVYARHDGNIGWIDHRSER